MSVSFSPDASFLASGGDDAVRVWSASSKSEKSSEDHYTPVSLVAFSQDGTEVLTACLHKGTAVKRWKVSSGECIHEQQTKWKIMAMSLEKKLAAASDRGWVGLLRLNTTQVLQQVQIDFRVSMMSISPDGKAIAIDSERAEYFLWFPQSSQGLRSNAIVFHIF
eukprot:TRINITY_DN9537_c0_g1_i3.p2 TRINITY_DN9537_c0_g1~~TRINITY_DN9537_c0_g1_i3.p2  ORF type:complete len:164 (+),score=23.89 TRINITY_DN9537_c0_g1_i3:939-1430(+)